MTPKRETFFRCTFSSVRRRRVAHVTAWDAKEAVQLFQAELMTDGVDERGTIEVTTPAGSTRRAAYRPTASATHAGA
jgi:hypothetical protein